MAMPTPVSIAQTTSEAYAAFNPSEALQSGDPRYVSLDKVRGTTNIADSLVGL
jgi:hypothetical protein